MTLKYKHLGLALLIPAFLFANGGKHKGKYTKEKTIHKEYSVAANALLKVDNSYGDIKVVSWDQNQVVIDVHIITNGNDEEKVQEKLDQITVDFSNSRQEVSAETIFKKNKSSWNWWGKNNNVSMEINYTIKVPVTNAVDLDNNYGAIHVNKLDGVAKIDCDYGQIIIGELNADGNNLNFDYTSKSSIGYMKSGSINADYSSFILDQAEQLDLNADYTKSEIDRVKTLNYNCDYGSVKVHNVGDLNGNGDYIPTRLGTVTGSVNLEMGYGSIIIERLTEEAGNVSIESDYGSVKIGYDSNYHFDFDMKLAYCGLGGADNLEITRSEKDGSKKSYKGYYGKSGSGNQITIISDYGGVSLIKK